MANYTKSTNFAAKDSLLTGNPSKLVRGTEIDTEYNNIATAITSKADLNSPAFTGTPTAPTASSGTNTTQVATTAFVTSVFPTSNIAFSGDNTHVGLETFRDNKFEITDNTDTTKKVNFEVSGLTTSTTRTLTVPDKNGTIALTSDVASVSALSTQNNTIITGTYSASASSTISITATHAFSVGQEVFITFTNTSGSALAAGKFTIVTVTGTTAFTITYGSSVTSAGNVTVERYGLIAVANDAQMVAGTSQITAVTPKLFKDYIGLQLLGTISTSSGTSANLSGLSLTGYKQIQFVFSQLSSTSTSSFLTITDPSSTVITVAQFSSAASTAFMTGIMTLDLATGVICSVTTRAAGATPSTQDGQVYAGSSTFSTSTTSFTFNVSTGNFDAGSIRVYGVR